MSGSRFLRAAVVFVLATGAAVVAPAAARADDPVNSDGAYCVYNSDNGVMACVADEDDYPLAADAAGVDTQGRSDPSDVSPLVSVQLARFYDNANFDTSAGYIDFFGTASCTTTTTDIDDSWSDTTSWRSRISSWQGFSNCAVKGYQSTSFGGTSLGYSSSAATLGSLNDHIWSARFS